MLLQSGKLIRRNQLDALAAKVLGNSTHLISAPILSKAPRNYRLVDTPLTHPTLLLKDETLNSVICGYRRNSSGACSHTKCISNKLTTGGFHNCSGLED